MLIIVFLVVSALLVSLLVAAWLVKRAGSYSLSPVAPSISDDEMRARVVMAVYRTGRPHLATRDESGTVTVRPLGDDDK